MLDWIKKHIFKNSTLSSADASHEHLKVDFMAEYQELFEMTAEDVMVTRQDVIAFPMDITFDKALELAQKEPHSRYPVYGDNLDDIRGFITMNDLLRFVNKKGFSCRKALNRILFVPTSTPLIDVLMRMREEHIPIAAVVDEYGGTDGVVTPWDIFTTVLGEIRTVEEEEEDDPKILKQKDGSYFADGLLPIEDLEEVIGKVLSDEEEIDEIETINGLLLFIAGRVPNRHEIIRHDCGWEFHILEANPRRVLKVRIIKDTTAS